MTGQRAIGLGRRNYALLLTLLLVVLASESNTVKSGGAALISDVFRTLLGIAVWAVVFRRKGERRVMGAVLIASIAVSWTRTFVADTYDHEISLANQVLLAVFLWGAVYAILRDLFIAPASGVENVMGAICGYIIAGDAWARINAIAYLLVPAAYSINPEIAALLPDWRGRVALFTYYAFAQVLTIGYSDVTPIRTPATTLSLFAALFGVFYTAVVVSQFVGLAQQAKPPPGDP